MAGRLEIRDWIDMILCVEKLQDLGYLAFAACGKDPGFSPGSIVEYASRCSRYTKAELLPPERTGCCVRRNGELFRGSPEECRLAVKKNYLEYLPGKDGALIGRPFPDFIYPNLC